MITAPTVLSAVSLILLFNCVVCAEDDPTQGFVQLPFNSSFYYIQKPYDLDVSKRYSFVNGTHKLWVYSTDKPLARSSPTRPRTEVIINVNKLLSLPYFTTTLINPLLVVLFLIVLFFYRDIITLLGFGSSKELHTCQLVRLVCVSCKCLEPIQMPLLPPP